MATLSNTWGWYATGLTNTGNNDAETLGGNSYNLGSGTGGTYRYQAYGTMQMYDANDDDRMDDTDTDDTTTSTSDRFVTADGVYRQVNEVVIYSNTGLTYTLPGGGTATWTVRGLYPHPDR